MQAQCGGQGLSFSAQNKIFALAWLGNVRREPYRNKAEGWCVPSTQDGVAIFGFFER